MDVQGFSLEWVIDAIDSGKSVKEFFKEQNISKSSLTDIKFKGGSILVNGKEMNVRNILQAGDRVKAIFPPEESSEGLQGEKIPLQILYEDEYLLVVHKPPAMNTIPSREHPSGSLANALIGYYIQSGIHATAHIVTRLDRDTSGIVLVAKHRHVHHLMSSQQKNGTVKRIYEALAEGIIDQDEGCIEEPIGRKPESIIEREVREDGQYACTLFRVLSRLRGATHIELRLKTGRTHQIRVHMSYTGHPLLGDDLYGGGTEYMKRQALHCRQITFLHPFTGEEMTFVSPLPEDMKYIIKTLS